jgi:phosphoribosylformylglycinamidine (FGAM) synthase-like amidotransferase family enzyme
MPHPERGAEGVLGGDDGRRILESVLAVAGVRV